MLDRFSAPNIAPIESVRLADIVSTENKNGVKIYHHYTPSSHTFKLELYSKASQLYAQNGAECHFSLKMLKEGTLRKSSKQIIEELDSLGSFLEITPGFDGSSITIFGLSKFFKKNVTLLQELIYEPAFKSSSFDKLKLKEVDRLKQNLEKGSYLSSIHLRRQLFGSVHSYGHILTIEDIQKISLAEIETFHSSVTLDFDIYLSGDVDSPQLRLLDGFKNQSINNVPNVFKESPSPSQNSEIRSDKFVQSSIKIGKRLFNRNHKDYFPFIVTNELLGGFFGSRLMRNLREEKGLTYGIHSHLYALMHDGYFFISTDIKGENESEAIQEIYKEIDLLATQRVTEEELDTVKNYMIGTYINTLSNPFGIIEKHKILISQNLPEDFYNNYVEHVRRVTPDIIQQTTRNYLNTSSLIQSIVGK